MSQDLSQRITEAADGLIGVEAGLLNACATLGNVHVTTFLDKIPERGEALWLRFKAFRDVKGADPETRTFNHFIASIIMPIPA